MNKRYIKRLTQRCGEVEFAGCSVQMEHEGTLSVYVKDKRICIEATPDWDERDTLPIEVVFTENDDVLEMLEEQVVWTGDLDADVKTWIAKVEPIVLKHGGGACRSQIPADLLVVKG